MSHNTVSIPLSGPAASGKSMLIDAADAPLFEGRKVNLLSSGYPLVTRDYKKILAHRLIIGAKKGQTVDHVNGDKLDNRRSNLRLCTPAQNAQNATRKASKGRKGVHWDKARKCYRVWLDAEGKMVYLGSFSDPAFGTEVYDAASAEHHGAFSLPNNIGGITERAANYLKEWYGPRWKAISPEGEEIYLDKITAFCRERGLLHSEMVYVSQGKAKTHKGWRCERLSALPSRMGA